MKLSFMLKRPSSYKSNSKYPGNKFKTSGTKYSRSTIMNLPKNPFPGSEIGIPLLITENVFSNLHYGYSITDTNDIIRQFLLGYIAYGYDRYFDSLDTKLENLPKRKQNLYEYYNKNRFSITISLLSSFLYILGEFSSNTETIPFDIILISILFYRNFKQNLGEFKAVYVSSLWTIASIIIPCVFHDHNYDIINYPLDYMPCFFSIYGGTTIGDMIDREEDQQNKINTLPVKYGNKNAYYIVIGSIMMSNVLLAINNNFMDGLLFNSLFEIQNTATLLLPLIQNVTLN